MKKLGVVFVVLGIIAAVIAFVPGLVEPNPADGFGKQQWYAIGIGAVLLLLGILMCAKGGACCCCAAPEAPKAPKAPAEPPAEE